MKKIFAVLFVIVLALAVVTPVMAAGLQQDAGPAASTPSAGEIVVDMALMVAITAFLKSLLNVTGKPVMAIAFGVGVVLWGAPLVSAAFPAVGVYLDSFLGFVKVWLGAMGSVDLVTSVGAKIATAKMTQSGQITTGTTTSEAVKKL
jgi:hypothetical protein